MQTIPPHLLLPNHTRADEGDDAMGADSAEAAARHHGGGLAGPDGLPLSPRSMPLGAKIKPLADDDEGGSQLSDAMLTAPPSAMGQRSPAILSPLKHGPPCPPVEVGGLGGGARGGHGLLPPLGLGDGGGGMPHSASMEVLMAPLPVGLGSGLEGGLEGGGLPRPDSMAALMGDIGRATAVLGGGHGGGLGPADSRDTSAMLGPG